MRKTRIEWCDFTWNVVTGCLHGCEYCYARRIAARFGRCRGIAHEMDRAFAQAWDEPLPAENVHLLDAPIHCGGHDPYPYAFEPTYHRYLLDQPAKRKKPASIFVCSMADLFGAWVPDEWIKQVFEACEAAPQHSYLFLTKNPGRYLALYDKKAFPYKGNYWFGTTVTGPDDTFTWMKDVPYHCFVSIEPLLEGGWGGSDPVHWPEWVIIGAMTGPGAKRHQPKAEWVADIVASCREAGVPVFMKDSLLPVVGEAGMVREWP